MDNNDDNCSSFESKMTNTDKENSLNAIKFRAQLKLADNPEYRKFEIKDGVCPYLYDALLVFIKSVLHSMSRYKRKYDIVCPLLRPLKEESEPEEDWSSYDPFPDMEPIIPKRVVTSSLMDGHSESKVETLSVYSETPFTVKDMLACFQMYPNTTIPKRNLYQILVLHVIELIHGRNPRQKITANSSNS